ncbi:MAG: hypothetical protein H6625_13800 [Bdellovibrionaceae bacterium]|nr:hypothetical protein [Pseudobdellovibrionaceae bacterium]
MKTPFPEATRIEWEVDDPVLFFQHLRSFFWQIESPTLFQIEEDLKNDFDCCVFEMPHYREVPYEEEPSFILLFEEGQIFTDFLDPESMEAQLAIIKYFTGDLAKIIERRKMTQKDWMARLDLLTAMESEAFNSPMSSD